MIRNHQPFPKVPVSFYAPTNGVCEFQVPHSSLTLGAVTFYNLAILVGVPWSLVASVYVPWVSPLLSGLMWREAGFCYKEGLTESAYLCLDLWGPQE